MKIFLGEKGLKASWQESFESTVECPKCKGEGRIMFVGFEEGKGKSICSLRENGGEGDFWVHDCIAVAVYLCKNCFESIAVLNQA